MCPPDPQITEKWYTVTSARIRKRTNEVSTEAQFVIFTCQLVLCSKILPQVPNKWKFDLLCLLEEHEDLHIILTDALMEVGTVSVDNILSKVN